MQLHSEYPITERHPNGLRDFNEKCFICQTNLVDIKLKCGHSYCSECTHKLIKWGVNCPLCPTSATPVAQLGLFTFLSTQQPQSILTQERLAEIVVAAGASANRLLAVNSPEKEPNSFPAEILQSMGGFRVISVVGHLTTDTVKKIDAEFCQRKPGNSWERFLFCITNKNGNQFGSHYKEDGAVIPPWPRSCIYDCDDFSDTAVNKDNVKLLFVHYASNEVESISSLVQHTSHVVLFLDQRPKGFRAFNNALFLQSNSVFDMMGHLMKGNTITPFSGVVWAILVLDIWKVKMSKYSTNDGLTTIHRRVNMAVRKLDNISHEIGQYLINQLIVHLYEVFNVQSSLLTIDSAVNKQTEVYACTRAKLEEILGELQEVILKGTSTAIGNPRLLLDGYLSQISLKTVSENGRLRKSFPIVARICNLELCTPGMLLDFHKALGQNICHRCLGGTKDKPYG